MRVAAVVDVPLTNGGGFNQSMTAVLQMRRICGARHELLVYTTVRSDIPQIEKLGLSARWLPSGWRDLWVLQSQTTPLLRKLRKRIRVKSTLESEMLGAGVDLAYFVGSGSRPLLLDSIPYIATVWDLCHLDHPEFPEVGAGPEFFQREFSMFFALPRAVAVVCASSSLALKISVHYGVDASRLIAMPFGPSPFLTGEASRPGDEVLRKYGIERGYYFYPAQFWAHKNHVRILQAMVALRARGVGRKAVFCGSDHGNLQHVRSELQRLGLESCVHILGFVPPEDMRGLYDGAHTVLMPSYFGPTNIPPLEAWACGVPLVCSSEMSDQVGDAGLVFNPDSESELADALAKVEDPAERRQLVLAGEQRLRQVAAEVLAAEEEVAAMINTFSSRLECWARRERGVQGS